MREADGTKHSLASRAAAVAHTSRMSAHRKFSRAGSACSQKSVAKSLLGDCNVLIASESPPCVATKATPESELSQVSKKDRTIGRPGCTQWFVRWRLHAGLRKLHDHAIQH
jgi:hypothetical protein